MNNDEYNQVWNVITEARVLRIGIVLQVETVLSVVAFDSTGKEMDTHDFAAGYPTWRKKVGIRRIGRMALYRPSVSILLFNPLSEAYPCRVALTLRNIDHRLEHQRHRDYEDNVVNEELWSSPFRWRSAIRNRNGPSIFAISGRSCALVGGCSRARSNLQRSICGDGKTSVQSIEGV